MDVSNLSSDTLTAKIEPFDSFWEGPEDIEEGYSRFSAFYKYNYLNKIPRDKNSNVLVVSCGPGYFVELLVEQGYKNVLGLDSDPEKIRWAIERGLPCKTFRMLEYLNRSSDHIFDCIFFEQELNHLTKCEIIKVLNLVSKKLAPQGHLICHSLNGANPITGAEALAQNFDHYNSCTEYTLHQILEYCGFIDIEVCPLNLYVFWKNPLNYLLIAGTSVIHGLFRMLFIIYGKKNKLFTKKIAAVSKAPVKNPIIPTTTPALGTIGR